MVEAAADIGLTTARLAALAPAIVAAATGVDGLRRLSGGAVNEMWAFDIHSPDGVVPLVLRRGVGGERSYSDAIPIATEAAVVSRAADHDIPVARPRYLLVPADGLGAGFVSDRIDGETIGGRIVRRPELAEARAGLAYRCGEVLAMIHAIDPAGIPGLVTRTAASFVTDLAARYRALPQPRPVLALALRWIAAQVPADGPLHLVHGDFRNGNIIVGPDGLRAVLDWEGAHLSDPMADIGFLCMNSWRFGAIDRPVGGFGSRAELFAGYAAAGGTADPVRARFWQVFGTFRWAVMCASMASGGALGSSPVEAALIARRTSESEIDLLDLITGRGD